MNDFGPALTTLFSNKIEALPQLMTSRIKESCFHYPIEGNEAKVLTLVGEIEFLHNQPIAPVAIVEGSIDLYNRYGAWLYERIKPLKYSSLQIATLVGELKDYAARGGVDPIGQYVTNITASANKNTDKIILRGAYRPALERTDDITTSKLVYITADRIIPAGFIDTGNISTTPQPLTANKIYQAIAMLEEYDLMGPYICVLDNFTFKNLKQQEVLVNQLYRATTSNILNEEVQIWKHDVLGMEFIVTPNAPWSADKTLRYVTVYSRDAIYYLVNKELQVAVQPQFQDAQIDVYAIKGEQRINAVRSHERKMVVIEVAADTTLSSNKEKILITKDSEGKITAAEFGF